MWFTAPLSSCTKAEPQQALSPGGLSGSESSNALQEHPGTSEGKPRSRMQHIQLHKSFFFTDIRHQEFEDNSPPLLLGFFTFQQDTIWTLLNGVYKASPESSLDNVTRNNSPCHLTVHRCKAIHAAVEVNIYIFSTYGNQRYNALWIPQLQKMWD